MKYKLKLIMEGNFPGSPDIDEKEINSNEFDRLYDWFFKKYNNKENKCWNYSCKHYDNGVCNEPNIPLSVGCPASWTFYVRRLYNDNEI